MVTDAIVGFVVHAIQSVFSLLPSGNLLNIFGPIDALCRQIGAQMASWNTVAPFAEALNLLAVIVGVVMPAVITYKLANWTWRHIPDLWGFGPGAG